jgi:hypothetical protein
MSVSIQFARACRSRRRADVEVSTLIAADRKGAVRTIVKSIITMEPIEPLYGRSTPGRRARPASSICRIVSNIREGNIVSAVRNLCSRTGVSIPTKPENANDTRHIFRYYISAPKKPYRNWRAHSASRCVTYRNSRDRRCGFRFPIMPRLTIMEIVFRYNLLDIGISDKIYWKPNSCGQYLSHELSVFRVDRLALVEILLDHLPTG